MNDKEKALAYLDKMQSNAKLHGGKSPLGLPHDPMIIEPVNEEFNQYALKAFVNAGMNKGEVEKMLKKREEIYHRLKSEFAPNENPSAIFMLSSLGDKIRQSCSILNLKFPENVVLGTMPTGKINAWANPVPESNYKIIVVDEGVFTLINLFAKLINFICQEEKEKFVDYPFLDITKVTRYIDQDEGINYKFNDMLLAYLITGNANKAAPYFEKESEHIKSSLLRESAELFMLAHEYGHVFYGHYEKLKTAEDKLKSGDLKIERRVLNFYKEQMADDFATYIVLGYNYMINKRSVSDSTIGITFLFSIIQILEEALSLNLSNTHPDAVYRINGMHKFLVDKLKPRLSQTGFIKYLPHRIKHNVRVGLALRASNRINKIMMYLWDKNKEKILELIKKPLDMQSNPWNG